MEQALAQSQQDGEREKQRRATPQAREERMRSRSAYRGADGAKALEVAKGKFGREVSTPAWKSAGEETGQRVVKFLSDHSALIEAGSGPKSLVESVLPMRSTDQTGQPAAINLGLERHGNGFKPKNAAGTELPDHLADGLMFPKSHVRIGLGAVDAGVTAQSVDGKLFYADVAHDTDFFVAPTPTGVRTYHQLRSDQSPEDLPLNLSLPDGAHLHALDGGVGVEVIDANNRVIMGVSAPHATDAGGQPVPTTYEVHGSTITLHVAHHGLDWMYPILVDPAVTDDYAPGYYYPGGPYTSNWSGWDPNPDFSSGRIRFDADSTVNMKLYLRATANMQHYQNESRFWAAYSIRDSFIWKTGWDMDFAAGWPDGQSYGPPFLTALGLGIRAPSGAWEGPAGRNPLIKTAPENFVDLNVCARTNCAVDGTPGNAMKFYLQAQRNFKSVSEPRAGLFEGKIYRSDHNFPYLKDGSVPLSKSDPLANDQWQPENKPSSFDLTAHDDGLGVKSIILIRPGVFDVHTVSNCTGTWLSQCPGEIGSTFKYNTDDVPEGVSTFYRSTKDIIDQGDQSNHPYNVKVDKTPPDTLALSGSLNDANGKAISGDAYSLHVDSHDAYSGVQSVSIKVDNNAPQSFANSGCTASGCPASFSPPDYSFANATAGEGPHSITVTATDQVGHATPPKTIQVITDRQAPTVSSVTHQGLNGWNDANDITSTVAAHDDGTGVSQIKVFRPTLPDLVKDFGCAGTVADRCQLDRSNPFLYNAGSLPEGDQTLSAKAYDAAGHESAPASWHVKVDHTPPSLAVSGTLVDQDGKAVGDGTFALHAQAGDSLSGVKSIAVQVDAGSPDVATNANCTGDGCPSSQTRDFSFDPKQYPDGVRDIAVTATDLVGRLTTRHIKVIVDNTPPNLDDPQHTNLPAGWAKSATPSVVVSAHDVGSGVKSFTLTTPTTGLVGMGAPLAGPGTRTQTQTLSCAGTIADPCPHDATSRSFSYSSEADSIDHPETAMSEGRNAISLNASDAVGRVSAAKRWLLKIDRSGPDVQLSGPVADSLPLFTNGQLHVRAVDGSTPSDPAAQDAAARSGVRKITVLIDGKEQNPQLDEKTQSCGTSCPDSLGMDFDWSYPTDLQRLGAHEVTVVVVDQAGNETRTTRQVTSACSQQSPAGNPDPAHAGCPAVGEQDNLGLEDWFTYKSIATGAGTRAHVNLQTGNLVWNALPIVNPGRGLSTFANVTYNSQVRLADLYGHVLPGQPVPKPPVPGAAVPDTLNPNQLGSGQLGPGFSIGVSGVTRLNEPLDVTHADQEIGLIDPDGTKHAFVRNSPRDAAFTPPPGVHLFLREFKTVPDPAAPQEPLRKFYAMTRPDGVTYYFDPLGYATSIEDRNGNQITFNYELNTDAAPVECPRGVVGSRAVCRLSSITDATGRKLQIKYEPINTDPAKAGVDNVPVLPKITQLIDHQNRVTGFAYNADGELAKLTEGAAPAAGGTYSGGRSFAFHWTSGTAEDPARIDAVTDPRAHNTTFGYDNGKTGDNNSPGKILAGVLSPRRVAWVADRDQAPAIPDPNNPSASDAYAKTQFAYETNRTDQPDPNNPGQHQACLPPPDALHPSDCVNYAKVTDQRGYGSNYKLDARGRALRSTDPRNANTDLAWDPDNNVVKLTQAAESPDAAASTMTYNPNGLLTAKTDPLGHTTKLAYQDSAGTQNADLGRDTCSPLSTPAGSALAADPVLCGKFVSDKAGMTTARGNSFTYHPDERGNNLGTDDPEGAQTHTSFGPHGEIVSETDAVGNLTQYPLADFDASGMPQTKIDPRGKKWQYRYDAVGNVLSVTDPRGSSTDYGTPYTTSLTYDSFDRLREQHIPKDSSVIAASESDRFITKKTDYDANDNTAATTDGTGAQGKTEFTAMDQPFKVTSPAVPHAGESTAAAEVSAYAYDPAQHLIAETKPMGTRSGAAAGSYSTKYVLDENGQPVVAIRRSRGASDDQSDLLTSYAYDLRGNLTGMVDPNANAANFAGMEADAQTARANAASGCSSKCRTRYEYDLANNRTAQVEDPGGKNYRTQTSYDEDNNKTSRIDPRGFQAGNNQADYTTTVGYDKRDMLTGINQPHGGVNPSDGLTSYHRRADGKIDQVSKPNRYQYGSGYTTSYDYWPTGQLKQYTLPQAPNEYPAGQGMVQYALDDAGNAASVTDARGNQFTNSFYDSGELKSTTRPSWWTYDPQKQGKGPDPNTMGGQQGGAGAQTPGPFALRERTTQEMAQGAQQQSPSDHPSTVLQGNFGSTAPVPMPELLPKAGATSFTYDNAMRLNGVSDAVGSQSTMSYDALGRTTQMSQPFDAQSSDPGARSITRKMGYDYNGNPVESTDGDGNTSKSTFDQFDRVTRQDAPGAAGAPGAQPATEAMSRHYDANGNAVSMLDPRGLSSTMRYDALDRLMSSTAPGGRTSSSEYDAAGNPTAETSPKGNAPGAPKSDYTTTQAFDARNELVKQTNGLGQDTTTTYDGDGNKLTVTKPGAQRASDASTEAQVTSMTYDGRDMPWASTTSGDKTRTQVTEFDQNGNPRRSLTPSGVDGDTKRASITDTGGPVDASSDAAKNATVREYTPDNVLQKTWLPWGDDNPSDLKNPSNSTRFHQDFTIDGLGRTTTVGTPTDAASDSNPTKYGYYENGWIKSSTDPTITATGDDYRHTVTYSYDHRGNQTRWDSSGSDAQAARHITRGFYPNGLLQSRSATASNAPDRSYSYFYNPDHGLVQTDDLRKQTDGSQDTRTTKVSYDDANRPILVDQSHGWAGGRGKDTATSYDLNGNAMQRMTDGVASTPGDPAHPGYQGGKTTDFSYDVLDREQRMHVTGTDEHDRTFTSAYWPSGDIQTRTRQQDTGPSVTENSFYFSNGQLSRKERHKPDGTMDGEDATTYAYNQNGDATTDERGTHDYNARDQETAWTRAGHYGYAAGKTVSYKLDGAGQIIDSHDSVDPGTDTHYDYLAGGRLHKQTTTGGGVSQTAYYCYDAFGSNTKITDQAGASGGGNCDMSATTPQTTRYWFDPFERMMKSHSADQGTQSYSYDGLDRRDTKCKGDDPANCATGARTDYSYVGLSQNLSSQKADGTTSTDMSMGWDYNSSGEPMGMSSKPATQTAGTQMKYMSYAKDAKGSISGLEGSDGTIKAPDRYHYDPYGSLQDTSAAKPAGDPAASAEKTLTGDARNNPMRFEGFYYDSGVKTYDMQARQYRPDAGRFLSQDRYEAAQGDLNLQADPLTQNRYAFAGGNPTNNIEFDGHTGNSALDCLANANCANARWGHHSQSGSSRSSAGASAQASNIAVGLAGALGAVGPRAAPSKPKSEGCHVNGVGLGLPQFACDARQTLITELQGAGSQLKSEATAIGNTVAHPLQTAKGIANHPLQAAVSIPKNIVEPCTTGDPNRAGGSCVANVLTLGLGGIASKIGRAGKAVEDAGTAGRATNFIAHPNGEVVPVPDGATGPTQVRSGNGFQFRGGSGGHGLDPGVTDVRIMDPVTKGPYRYPNGYVSYSNAAGQTVDPFGGGTIGRSNPLWHWPFSSP